MDSGEIVDHLIVGSGPAALAAAMALRQRGENCRVVDAGFDLEPAREARAEKMARESPEDWSESDRQALFPPPRSSARGVEKRFAFGSDFPYRSPDALELACDGCAVDVSHGWGGFGNVWGAAVLPYADSDMADWPVRASELRDSYRRVAEFMPISGGPDALEGAFPRFGPTSGSLKLSDQMGRFDQFLRRRQPSLLSQGILAGRARVAVDSSGGATTCRYCGECLSGCVYGSIFSPRQVWRKFERDSVRRGLYALEFHEEPGWVRVTLLDLRTRELVALRARRLYLAAGALNTTRIVARSLGLTDQAILLKDSQYFFFPLLAYRGAADFPRFTLAEAFLELQDPKHSPLFTHFQVYGLNSIFRQTIRAMLPAPLRRPWLLDPIERRFFLFQGFLHSELSGKLEFRLEHSHARGDRVRVRGIPHPGARAAARSAQRILRGAFASFGLIPPFYLNLVALGRSFHVGGSFPMGGRDGVFRSDRLGRPAGLQRTHLLDASVFPSIPATTITYTVMANSDRIVRESLAGAGA